MAFSVVKEQIEVSRDVTELPQQQRNLRAVMDTMIGSVLHQLAQRHRPQLAAPVLELDGSTHILVPQLAQEQANPTFDCCPCCDETLHVGVVVCLERRPARMPAAS